MADLRIIALSTLMTLLLFAINAERLSNNSIEAKHENAVVEDPEAVAAMVDMTIRNSTDNRRNLAGALSCGSGNPIDDCWRCDPHWLRNRKRLADCSIGFGRSASGGRSGRFYTVSDPSDDPVSPSPGTLRHAAIQSESLWIVFSRDMSISLSQELLVASFKTIDARGARVHVANGACITLDRVTNVIIHGLSIHDCRPTGRSGVVRTSPTRSSWRTNADGDGISLVGASHVWIDHNSLSSCKDGLIDAIMGSTAITISNNHFSHHNEVMLLGHSDSYVGDRGMQVTVAYNHFGEGLTQRMPRCRHGYFHVVNNDYTSWEMYAIGGSANPTINSQGNRFLAPTDSFAKEVTKRVVSSTNEWKDWNWRSEGDMMLNGAFFVQSGSAAANSYARASSLSAKSSSLVAALTSEAGVLHCRKGVRC